MTARQDEKAVRGRRRRIWIRVAVTGVILTLLFTQVSLPDLAASVRDVRLPPLGGAWLIAFVSILLVAERLHRLAAAQGLNLSRPGLIQINLATRFYGLFLPGGSVASLVYRVWRVGASEGRYGGAATVLVFDRMIATGTLCAVGIGIYLAAPDPASAIVAGVMAAVLGITLAVQALSGRVLPSGIRRLEARLLERVPSRIASLWREIDQARRFPAPTLVVAWTLGIVNHLVGTVGYLLIADALGLELSIFTIAWVRAVSILVTTLNISFNGLGVRELLFVTLLAPYGLGATEAVAFSLMVFAVMNLSYAIVGGVLEAGRVAWPLIAQRGSSPERPTDASA